MPFPAIVVQRLKVLYTQGSSNLLHSELYFLYFSVCRFASCALNLTGTARLARLCLLTRAASATPWLSGSRRSTTLAWAPTTTPLTKLRSSSKRKRALEWARVLLIISERWQGMRLAFLMYEQNKQQVPLWSPLPHYRTAEKNACVLSLEDCWENISNLVVTRDIVLTYIYKPKSREKDERIGQTERASKINQWVVTGVKNCWYYS